MWALSGQRTGADISENAWAGSQREAAERAGVTKIGLSAERQIGGSHALGDGERWARPLGAVCLTFYKHAHPSDAYCAEFCRFRSNRMGVGCGDAETHPLGTGHIWPPRKRPSRNVIWSFYIKRYYRNYRDSPETLFSRQTAVSVENLIISHPCVFKVPL